MTHALALTFRRGAISLSSALARDVQCPCCHAEAETWLRVQRRQPPESLLYGFECSQLHRLQSGAGVYTQSGRSEDGTD